MGNVFWGTFSYTPISRETLQPPTDHFEPIQNPAERAIQPESHAPPLLPSPRNSLMFVCDSRLSRNAIVARPRSRSLAVETVGNRPSFSEDRHHLGERPGPGRFQDLRIFWRSFWSSKDSMSCDVGEQILLVPPKQKVYPSSVSTFGLCFALFGSLIKLLVTKFSRRVGLQETCRPPETSETGRRRLPVPCHPMPRGLCVSKDGSSCHCFRQRQIGWTNQTSAYWRA